MRSRSHAAEPKVHRRPLMRFTVRRLIALVAVVAVLLGWLLNRPYPVGEMSTGALWIIWSDGTVAVQKDGVHGVRSRGTSWFRMVDWSDGHKSFYLTLKGGPPPQLGDAFQP